MFTCMLFIKKKKCYLYATASKLKERGEKKTRVKKRKEKNLFTLYLAVLFSLTLGCLVFSTIKS
jgi:hypothetical protein